LLAEVSISYDIDLMLTGQNILPMAFQVLISIIIVIFYIAFIISQYPIPTMRSSLGARSTVPPTMILDLFQFIDFIN